MEQARWPTRYRVSLDSVCWITRVLPRGSRFSGLTLFIVMHACLDLSTSMTIWANGVENRDLQQFCNQLFSIFYFVKSFFLSRKEFIKIGSIILQQRRQIISVQN